MRIRLFVTANVNVIPETYFWLSSNHCICQNKPNLISFQIVANDGNRLIESGNGYDWTGVSKMHNTLYTKVMYI